MTVRQKLILFFLISFIFLFALIIVNYYFNLQREKSYITNQIDKLISSSKSAIELNNEFYKNITFDYTYWDDMRDFNLNPVQEWADSNIGSIIDAYGIDFVWVYNLSGTKQFNSFNQDYSEIENPLQIKDFYNIFDTIQNGNKRFTSFYLKIDTTVAVIFGATIHSTDDIDRVEKPTGFFFVGKVINDDYLKKLSTITNCESRLIFDTANISFDKESAIISCNNNLFTSKNEYIATISFIKEDNFINQDRIAKKHSMLVYIVIIILIILNSIIFSTIVVSKPLSKIKKSLDDNDVNPIIDLSKNKKNEFGQISKLIIMFFKQKQNLETEIEERKAIEEQLKESIEELRQKNEEIHAQTEELYKVNDELEKLSIVASKTNNSVIISNNNLEIEYVNEGFLNLYEISSNDWQQYKDKRIDTLSQNSEFLFFLNICKEFKKSEMYIAHNKTFKNNRKWIQTTITPTFDHYGNPEYYILIETDITFLKNAEEKIALQNKKITYSIHYARRIQNALFPPVNLLKKTFRDIFIFYQPKELISGDFYWLYTSGNLIYFAVADCTGHGVPGAFMSILSIALLNDIVKTTSENNNTALILEKLREKIVNALHQNDINSESKDGLDISISIIDKEKNILYFSGAHNSLLILNNDILEIKADKIPVSMSLKMKNFSNHTIKIKPNDTFYMFTDGFSDQFGYLSNRKYYKTKLKEFLYEIHEQPFDIQENLITNEFFNWMGNLSQVDDVLVVGFKI